MILVYTMTRRNDSKTTITVASTLRFLQLRSVQVSVCLFLLIGTVVLYAHMNNSSMHSYIITATNATGKNLSSRKDLRGFGSQSVSSETSSTKIILAFGRARWFDEWVGTTNWNTTNVFRTCPVSNCVLTKDKSMNKVADAIIYRWNNLATCRTKFKRGQVWVLFEHESPNYGLLNSLKNCNKNLVNWTMTYRRDSDFTFVLGQFLQHDTGYNVSEMTTLLRSKSKTAVGFISHCNAPSKRDAFIRKLRSFGVDIDIYGKCGNLSCGGERDTKWKGVWNVTSGHKDDCFDVLDSQYKFYLSFENALCKDYVTEKSLHLVLRHQIVPIIRDGANRLLYHPPHSYIDTKDFRSIEALAKHIKYVSENFDQYLKFFNWRKHYSVETVSGVLQSTFCDLCYRMHHQQRYKRLYRDVKRFYTQAGDKERKQSCSNILI